MNYADFGVVSAVYVILEIAILLLVGLVLWEYRALLRTKRRLAESQRMANVEETLLIGQQLEASLAEHRERRRQMLQAQGWDLRP